MNGVYEDLNVHLSLEIPSKYPFSAPTIRLTPG